MTPAIFFFLELLTVRNPRPILGYLPVQRVTEDLAGRNEENWPGLGIEKDQGVTAMDHVFAVRDLAA
jgi:hypothetical protein